MVHRPLPLVPAEGAGVRGPVLEGVPDESLSQPPTPEPWILEVRLVGLPADARPPTHVSVMPEGGQGDREDHEIQVVEDETPGLVVFDVTEAVHAGALRLRVRATPRDAFPGRRVVELPVGVNLHERGGRLAVEIPVTAAAVLEGRVVDGTGKPVVSAVVVVDTMDAPREPRRDFKSDADVGLDAILEPTLREHGAPTDADGRFCVLAAGPPQVVLVAGWAPRLAPTVSGPITLRLGTRQDVGDLVLGRAEHLRGRVIGADALPGRPCTAHAQRLGARRELFESLMRTSTGAVHGRLESPLDAEGGFDLDGADDGVWLVTAQAQGWGCALSHEVARRARTLVRGPAENLVLDVRRALLRTYVRDEQGPLDGALVLVEGPDTMAFRTSDGGHGAVVLLPDTTYRVLAWAWWHGVERRTITTGRSGGVEELHFTLSTTARDLPAEIAWVPTGPEDPTLRLSVKSWDDTLLPAALRLRNERGEDVPATWIEHGNGVTWLVKDVLPAREDAWLTTRLGPGVYVLEVSAPLHRTEQVRFEIGENGRAANRLDVKLTPR